MYSTNHSWAHNSDSSALAGMIARLHTVGAADAFVAVGVGATVVLADACEASIASWSCGASAVTSLRRPPCAICSSSSVVGLHGNVHVDYECSADMLLMKDKVDQTAVPAACVSYFRI